MVVTNIGIAIGIEATLSFLGIGFHLKLYHGEVCFLYQNKHYYQIIGGLS